MLDFYLEYVWMLVLVFMKILKYILYYGVFNCFINVYWMNNINII